MADQSDFEYSPKVYYLEVEFPRGGKTYEYKAFGLREELEACQFAVINRSSAVHKSRKFLNLNFYNDELQVVRIVTVKEYPTYQGKLKYIVDTVDTRQYIEQVED